MPSRPSWRALSEWYVNEMWTRHFSQKLLSIKVATMLLLLFGHCLYIFKSIYTLSSNYQFDMLLCRSCWFGYIICSVSYCPAVWSGDLLHRDRERNGISWESNAVCTWNTYWTEYRWCHYWCESVTCYIANTIHLCSGGLLRGCTIISY